MSGSPDCGLDVGCGLDVKSIKREQTAKVLSLEQSALLFCDFHAYA